MDDEKGVKIYRLKIVYKGNTILHFSESVDDQAQLSFNINGESVLVPEELAEILETLDSDELATS